MTRNLIAKINVPIALEHFKSSCNFLISPWIVHSLIFFPEPPAFYDGHMAELLHVLVPIDFRAHALSTFPIRNSLPVFVLHHLYVHIHYSSMYIVKLLIHLLHG